MKWFQSLKLAVGCVLFLLPLFLHANDDEKIRRGVERLNALIAQNKYNDAHGLSHKNKYIFNLDESNPATENPPYLISHGTPFITSGLSEVEKELSDLAVNSDIHVYIALNGSQLVVGELNEEKNKDKSVDSGKLTSEAYNKLSNEVFTILRSIHAKSRIESVGSKNILLGITPVQRVDVHVKDKTKDRLYFTFLRNVIPGAAYPKVVDIVNTIYKTTDQSINSKYSRDPYQALITQKNLYVGILKDYVNQVQRLFPAKTQAANDFIHTYKETYFNDPRFKVKIDSIAAVIDEDEGAFNEMMALIAEARKFNRVSDEMKYVFYNQNFTITRGVGGVLNDFSDFKKGILAYRKHKQNLLTLASQITCEPKQGESNDAFKGRVYFCAALLTPNTAASLDSTTRNNLLCALSKFELSGHWTVAASQLTSGSAKEEVVVRILKNTPTDQQKSVLKHLNETTNSASKLWSVLMSLDDRMHLQNYQDMMLTLIDWIYTHYPSKETWQQILERKDRSQRAILPLGTFTDGYTARFNSFSEGSKTTLYFKITENLTIPMRQHILGGIGAYDYVVVKFTKKYTTGGKTFQPGDVHVMPAMFAYLIMHNMSVNTWVTVGKYTLYAAAIAVTAGQIVTATTAIEATIAIVDMGVAASDILVQEVLAEELNKTPEGKQFLDTWNKYVLIYGGVRVVSEIAGLTTKLNELASKIGRKETDDIVRAINETQHVTNVSRWASKGYNRIEDWVGVIDDANLKTRIEGILSQWDNVDNAGVLRKIDDVLGNASYAGIADEFASTPELLVYLQRAEQHEWARFGLAAITKRAATGTVHPVKNSAKFSQVINDYEIAENTINRRLASLTYIDEANPGDLGKLFDDWMERAVREAWEANDFSSLPPGVANRLTTLKEDYVMIQQARVSRSGSTPVPDLLFVRKETVLGREVLNKSDCIYIDNKILWDTQFSAAQRKITDNVTAAAGARVKSVDAHDFGNGLSILPQEELVIVRVEAFSVNESIELVNLSKFP